MAPPFPASMTRPNPLYVDRRTDFRISDRPKAHRAAKPLRQVRQLADSRATASSRCRRHLGSGCSGGRLGKGVKDSWGQPKGGEDSRNLQPSLQTRQRQRLRADDPPHPVKSCKWSRWPNEPKSGKRMSWVQENPASLTNSTPPNPRPSSRSSWTTIPSFGLRLSRSPG